MASPREANKTNAGALSFQFLWWQGPRSTRDIVSGAVAQCKSRIEGGAGMQNQVGPGRVPRRTRRGRARSPRSAWRPPRGR